MFANSAPTWAPLLFAWTEVSTSQLVWGILWGGLAAITLSLLVLMQTRWGQARPVSKCVVLSISAHLLLMAYAQVTQLFAPTVATHSQPVQIRLSSIDVAPEQESLADQSQQPWDKLATTPLPRPGQLGEIDRRPVAPPQFETTASPKELRRPAPPSLWTIDQPDKSEPKLPTESAGQLDIAAATAPVQAASITPPPIEMPNPMPAAAVVRSAVSTPAFPQLDRIETTNAPPMPEVGPIPSRASQPRMVREMATDTHNGKAVSAEADRLQASSNRLVAMSGAGIPSAGRRAPDGSDNNKVALQSALDSVEDNAVNQLWAEQMRQKNLPLPQASRGTLAGRPLPLIMQARVASDHRSWVDMMGGSPEIEPAVEAALAWLAANQEEDGSWNVKQHGGGQEAKVAGHDRGGAGNDADMGVTGLATLAFLGKGYTHLEGPYQRNVQLALEYMVNHQHRDGSLDGNAGMYAKMYCHAMALLAISEAYAMTRDERIRPFLDRGLAFTIAAQHPRQGGWRYHPGDPGDMSQFGWQVLALHSAALSGVEIDEATRERMTRFMHNSSAGQFRGLSAYRPGERATPTMTAEALACRFFLGIENRAEQIDEAAKFLSQNLSTDGPVDLYYGYYGTLAMYQMQESHWRRWASVWEPRLLNSQVRTGELAGSWEPNGRWGGYGGRVYSTSMAALSLEVYFRYLPIYRPAAPLPDVQVAEQPTYINSR